MFTGPVSCTFVTSHCFGVFSAVSVISVIPVEYFVCRSDRKFYQIVFNLFHIVLSTAAAASPWSPAGVALPVSLFRQRDQTPEHLPSLKMAPGRQTSPALLFITALWWSSTMGDSGGVANSLYVCLASLKSLGCFYFRCVLSLQWKAVTVNLRILHCQH